MLSEGQQIGKKALAKKRIEATRRRSSDWIGPRQALVSKIPLASTEECERIEQELAAAHYDRMSINDLLARIRRLPEERQRELIHLLTAELA